MNRIKCFFISPTRKKRKRVITWDSGEKQTLYDTLYKRVDTGELALLKEFGPGAMWFAPWLDDVFQPQLEHVLVVKTPGGDWIIDSEANNCTNPVKEVDGKGWSKKRQVDHHCWILHGVVPEITVDKNGVTCGAGAGSIQCGSYHGFLRNGYLED